MQRIMTGMFANADSLWFVFLFYFYQSPKVLGFVMPFGVLAGAVLTGLSFASSNEWTSFRASGLSMRRASLSFLCGGIIWAIALALISETAAPVAAKRSHEIKRVKLEKRATAKRSTLQRWFRGAKSIAQIERYSATSKKVFGVQLERLDSSFKPFEVVLAETASPISGNLWRLSEVSLTTISGNDQTKKTMENLEIELPFKESQLVIDRKRESEYSIFELAHMVDERKLAGAEVTIPSFEMNSKIVLILFTILLPFCALRFAYSSERSPSHMGAVVSVFLVAGVYWVSLSVVRAFVLQTKLAPTLAGLPFVLAVVYILWDYRRAASAKH